MFIFEKHTKFSHYFYNIFLEGISPKDKIRKYKISDPFMIQFILRYGDEIFWNDVQTSEDIEKQIKDRLIPDLRRRLVDESHPKTVLFSGENMDVQKEVALVRQAHPEHYDAIKKIIDEKGEDEVKKYISNIINNDKSSVLNIWFNRITENIQNPAEKYIILKPVFDSTDSSKKKTPKPYIWSAVKNYLKTIEQNPYELKNLLKIYEETLSKSLFETERFKKIQSDELVWIKIPGENEDRKNFNSNVEALMGLSCNIWCISGKTMATRYLKGDGSFYLLLDIQNKKPTALMAIRMNGDKIEEIRGALAQQRFDPVQMENHLVRLTEEENLDKYSVWEWINEERKFRELESKILPEITDFKDNVRSVIKEELLEKYKMSDVKQLKLDFYTDPNFYENIEDDIDSIMNTFVFSEQRPAMGIYVGDITEIAEEYEDSGIEYIKNMNDSGNDITVHFNNPDLDEGNEIMTSKYTTSDVIDEIKNNIDFSHEDNADIVEAVNDALSEGFTNDEPYSFLSSLNERIDLSEIDNEIEEMYRRVSYAYGDGIRYGIENKMHELLNEHIKEYFTVVSGKYWDDKLYMFPVSLDHLVKTIRENSTEQLVDDLKDILVQEFKDNYYELDLHSAYNNYDFDMAMAQESYSNM